MEKEIVWSPRARKDLEEIYLYLLENASQQSVDKFLDAVEQKTNFILQMPYIYPKVADLENIRRCLIDQNISLYYKVLELKIQIITLIDNKQNPDILADRLK